MSASQTILPIAIQAVPSRSRTTHHCPECRCDFEPYKRARGYQVFCGQDCRVKAWKRAQGKRGAGRDTKATRILARLKEGEATTWDLARVGGIRFGARLLELRRAGHRITTEEREDHAVYRLEQEG